MSLKRKALRLIALLTIFSLAEVYVEDYRQSVSIGNSINTPFDQAKAATLVISPHEYVLVNGNSVPDGSTLYSGAQVRTPEAVHASIDLDFLGSIDLAPQTDAVLEFADGRINLRLLEGCVLVKAEQGINAQVNTRHVRAASSGPDQDEDLDVCFTPEAPNPLVRRGALAQSNTGTRRSYALAPADEVNPFELALGGIPFAGVGALVQSNDGRPGPMGAFAP